MAAVATKSRVHQASLARACAALIPALTLILAAPAGAATHATAVTVTAGKPSEFGFRLSTKTVKHGSVTLKVENGGQIPHDFKIRASPKGGLANACTGKVTRLLSPGASEALPYTFKTKGTYEYLCTVPGHAAAGMKGDLKVT